MLEHIARLPVCMRRGRPALSYACHLHREQSSLVQLRNPLESPQQALHASQVESCALLGNGRDNGFVGVNLYCDDEADFVDAPLNVRASDIAACCGRPMQVRPSLLTPRMHPCAGRLLVAPVLISGSQGYAVVHGLWGRMQCIACHVDPYDEQLVKRPAASFLHGMIGNASRGQGLASATSLQGSSTV